MDFSDKALSRETTQMVQATDKAVRMRGKPEREERETDPERDIIWSRGLRFPDRPAFLTQRLRRALRFNNYEKQEAEALKGMIRSEDVVLELGGGIGFMSSIAAKAGARAVHVYEPNPDAVAYARDVHALNEIETVTITNAIVGPKKGTATFYQRENMLTSSMEADPIRVDSPVVATHEIEVLNINTVWKSVKPTVLICDIEGAEANLFDKAQMTGLRLAVIELHPQWIGEAGVRAVFDAMMRAGLTYFPKASSAKVVTFKKDW